MTKEQERSELHRTIWQIANNLKNKMNLELQLIKLQMKLKVNNMVKTIKNSESNIIIYENKEGQTKISVKIDGETVWLTQAQLVDLFDSSKANVSEHIKNIYSEEELSPESTVRKFRTVQKEGNRDVSREIEHYNLDMIISIGYRIKSLTATRFRQWATARIKEYIVKGFSIDDERLKNTGGGNYWTELLEKIRYCYC